MGQNQNQQQGQASKTNAAQVRKQNAASAAGGQFGTEFASETNAQQVRQQNQQSQAKKAQSTTGAQNQQQ
ncbi:MAG TPA: gamma-type small acid-soluble spore protein [Bacillus sp. (in: firmicutes)]|uniref:gamma-type small acid-soluble spore protein n=1 Tax=Bacillus litorisediminis TaxID=2922713 RepID=UPI001FABEC71|nr:gamma-type small acid-soluble spore protein [Bacillus litorisediminis]HWO74676.1 gamma-type small acid-soluble spore protein [Bacillus sp. (in: firmicutes)]